MSILLPLRRHSLEYLDLPVDNYSADELQGTMKDLAVINRYLGNNRIILRHFSRLIAENKNEPVTILDIGTGLADIPMALAKYARKTNRRFYITCIDNNEETVEIARREVASIAEIKVEVADGLNLHYQSGGFDFVLCSKTLHHFDDQQGTRLISEMNRVAGKDFLLVDLRRSWIAYGLICLLTRLFTRNRLTRNDGPLSVLKAYTPMELAELAQMAGIPRFSIKKEPFWLMVLSRGAR